MPKGEPRTEAEAQEMKTFLEEGAPVALEPVRRLTAVSDSLVAVRPLPLLVPDVATLVEELSSASEDEGDRVTENRVVLELEFASYRVLPSYSVAVFVGDRRAGAGTSIDDPSFVGSIAFLCHAELVDGEPVCMHHEDEPPTVFRLPVPAEALEAAGRGPLSVNLVPQAYEGRKPTEPLDVAVTLTVVRSEYTRVS